MGLIDRLLRPEIGRVQFATLLYGSFVTIALIVFVNIGQPYVLLEMLKIEGGEGALTGNLAVTAEIVALLIIGYIGVLSDRFGRRPIIIVGALAMAVGYAVLPLVTTIAALFAVRIFLAVGTTAQTTAITTIMHDYAAPAGRGKLVAVVGVLMGIGVVLMNVSIGNLPSRLIDSGIDAISAGRWMHWIVAAICVLSAIIFLAGFRAGTPVKPEERLSQRELVRQMVVCARQPRIALAYAASFVSRSDLVILGTFIVLWGTVFGRDQGLETAAAMAIGVKNFVITQSAGLLCSPVLGIILDKVNRVSGLAFSSLVAALAYMSMFFVTDPGDPAYLPLFVFLGIGQTACNLAAQVLLGQEAPNDSRGAIIGGFGLCGTLGIIFSTWIGGIIFDLWMPSAPFVFVGVLTLSVFFLSLWVRLRAPGPEALAEVVSAR
jgi:MFS family permease